MLLNKFFKTSNAIICINFPKGITKLLNESDGPHLTNVHLMIYDIDDVNVEEMLQIIQPCRDRKIKIIMHCFNKQIKYKLSRKLKGVYKDRYFHFQINDKYIINFSSNCQALFEDKSITFTTKTTNGNSIQKIIYDKEVC